MSGKPTPDLAALDALIAAAGFPVRGETLEHAWGQAAEAPTSRRFQDEARRALELEGRPKAEVMILVTLRARPGRERELEDASREFVAATRQLDGSLGSSLYRSTADPLTVMLVERFTGHDVIARHMASDYFRRFQTAQQPLLAAPIEVVVLQRIPE
jgi:quinol monooxygenase YgiN